MARGGTFDSKRAQARVLSDEGLSCNAIAKRLKCAPSRVSRWAKSEGLSFDRSQTKAAVEAHTVDLAAERLALAEEMMEAGRAALREVKGPVVVYNFGGLPVASRSLSERSESKQWRHREHWAVLIRENPVRMRTRCYDSRERRNRLGP